MDMFHVSPQWCIPYYASTLLVRNKKKKRKIPDPGNQIVLACLGVRMKKMEIETIRDVEGPSHEMFIACRSSLGQ